MNGFICLKPTFEFVQTVDNDMALKIYIKARVTPKVVAAFAERREFDKILIYSKQVCTVVKPEAELVKVLINCQWTGHWKLRISCLS